MSEFLCYNGHDMRPSRGPICGICGSGVYTMDGMTASQIRRQEREEYERGFRYEDEDEEGRTKED